MRAKNREPYWWKKKWDNICPICINKIRCDRGELFKTACNHYYHMDCFVQYINTNNVCAVCRSVL